MNSQGRGSSRRGLSRTVKLFFFINTLVIFTNLKIASNQHQALLLKPFIHTYNSTVYNISLSRARGWSRRGLSCTARYQVYCVTIVVEKIFISSNNQYQTVFFIVYNGNRDAMAYLILCHYYYVV